LIVDLTFSASVYILLGGGGGGELVVVVDEVSLVYADIVVQLNISYLCVKISKCGIRESSSSVRSSSTFSAMTLLLL
jgi:hypothetical protein